MITDLLAFALAATLLVLAPGPDSLMVMRNTLRAGRRAGWATAGGTMSGLAIWAIAAAFGLAALVRASHLGYDALRFAGAGYLIWLGIGSLRSAHRRQSAGDPLLATPRGAVGRTRAYLNGLLSNLFNPKIGVFFVAFLPGFVPAGAPVPLFALLLGLWFILEAGAWLAALTWLTSRGAAWLHRPAIARRLEGLAGVVLIGFGIRLATQAR
jgi:threonine/homoserine/homoserine lactone efflux protein